MPTRAFWVDLARHVRLWRTAGEGVILFGDTNMKLRTPQARARLVSMGLSDAISPFANEDEVFSTYDRRGSTVIDGCWIMGDINRVSQGGYLPFRTGLSMEHRCAWIDIGNANLLGYDPVPIRKAQARRLQCKNQQCERDLKTITPSI
jgi:hypothetical protein